MKFECGLEPTSGRSIGDDMPSILPPKTQDWTDRELAEIERVKEACACHPLFEIECSHTDEGDPWCIVYDQARNQIILHIARIDRRYVLVRPMKGSERCTSIGAAIETALSWLTEQWSRGPAR